MSFNWLVIVSGCNAVKLSLANWHTGTLAHWHTGTLAHWYTGTLVHWHTGTPTQLRYRTRPLDTDQGEEGLSPWEIICNTWRILWQTVRNCHSVLGIYWQPILGSWQIMHVPGFKSSPGFIFTRVLFFDQIIIKSCFHLTRFDQIWPDYNQIFHLTKNQMWTKDNQMQLPQRTRRPLNNPKNKCKL